MSGQPPLTPGGGGAGLGSNLSFKMPARPGSSLRKARQSASETNNNNNQSTPSTPAVPSFIQPSLPLPSPLAMGGVPGSAGPASASSLPSNPFEDALSTQGSSSVPGLFTPLGHRRGNSRSSDILLAAAAGSAGGHQQQHPSRPQSPSSSSVGHENVFDTTVTLSTAVAHALSASAQGRQRLQELREGLENQTHAAAALGANLMDQLKRIDGMTDALNKEMHALQARQVIKSEDASHGSPAVDDEDAGDDSAGSDAKAKKVADEALDPESEQEKETQNEMRRKIAALQASIESEVADMESNRLDLIKTLIDAGPKRSPTAGVPASASILDMLAGLNSTANSNGLAGGAAGSRGAGFPPESPSKNAAAAAAAAYDFLNSDPHSLPTSRSSGANTSLAALLAGGTGANGSAGPTARQSDRRARNAAARSSITDQSLVNQLQEGLVSEIRRLQALLGERDTELVAVRSQKEESEKEAALWKPKALQLIENEDALKQENWDLSVAKQNLAEQLVEAQASLRKAEAEKTRLNRDVTKARETLDSQRAEIEAQTTELERIKNLRETEAALARKERAGLQRDYSNLQTEIQHLRAEGKRAGVSISGIGAALGAAGARSASSSMMEDSSRLGDVSTPIPEEDERAGGRNLLEPGAQGGPGGMSPSSSIFSEMPADRSAAPGVSTSAVLPGAAPVSSTRAVGTAAPQAPPTEDAHSQELRIRLARAHQKSIRDAAERKKQRELIVSLTRELQAAGVKLSAGLESAAFADAQSAEASEEEGDEGSIWLNDDEQASISRSRASRTRPMPRSSTRPSMASRLGLGSKTTEEQLSEDEDDEDVAELAEENGEQASKTDSTAEASTARADSLSADATQSPQKPRAAGVRARPLSVASTTAGSSVVAETLGTALAAAPVEEAIKETAEVSIDAGKSVSLHEAGAQTDEVEEEEVWAPAEEEHKTMTESQSMTDPIDTEAPLRAALAERDAAHAAVLTKLELEHRSKMEELVRTHDGVLGSRDANHARALEVRNAEHVKAVEVLQADHQKALADATAAHEKALTDIKSAHDKALAENKTAHEQALADAQAAHEQALATEVKTAHEKALEQARIHQESALAEARSRHSKALAEQVAAGSAALAAASAAQTKALSDRDASHKTEVQRIKVAHEGELEKRKRQAEAEAAASAALLKKRDEEHAAAVVELKVAHSALIRQKDTAQLAALAERDEAVKKSRAETDTLQRKVAELNTEVERLRKEAADAKAAHAEAVANAAAAATAAAQAAAEAAAASGTSPSSVNISAEELERKLRPLSGISDDSLHRGSSTTTDVESSDAFTDAEDHMTPARTPTPAQTATMGGLGFGGRVAAGLAAAVGLGAASTQRGGSSDSNQTGGVGTSVKGEAPRDESGVKRVVLAELQDESCQTDEVLWEAYKAELRAEGAAQAQSQVMHSSSTITGLDSGVMVAGGLPKSRRDRDSISTFGGGHTDDGEAQNPTMYSVGALLGSGATAGAVAATTRHSTESSVTGAESVAGTVGTAAAAGSRLDKTKPPHMQVPPPPAMPPPPGLSGRRSQPSPVLAGVPPRPTSPPPPELVSRVREQNQRSTLQVPGKDARPSMTGVATSVGGATAGAASGHVPRDASATSLRTRKHSNDTAFAGGAAANGDHLSAHSRHSRRGKVPRKSSQTSFASDVTSELSRRISFGSSRNSEALADRTESHLQTNVGSNQRTSAGPGQAPEGTDPDIIQAITQTMIGEYLFKYTRKTIRSGYSDKRHKRFFWVHPYTRMLYWTLNDPGGARVGDGSSKGAAIEDVRVVEDTNPNPPGLFHMSIIVKTSAREMKLTAPNKDRHDVWLAALGYLVNRGMPGSDAMSVGDGGGLTDQENRYSNAASPRKARDRSATTGTANSRNRFLSPARSLRSRKSNDAFLYGQGQSTLDANDATPRARNGSIGASSTLNLSSTKRAGLPAREYLEQVESDQAARRAAAAQKALLPQRSHLRPRTTGGSENGLQPSTQTPGKMSVGSAFGIPGSAGVVAAQQTSPALGPDDSWDRLADLSAHSFNDPRLKTAEEMIEEDNAGFEGLDNVRACCDGKHDVGSLAHKHHHHHHHHHKQPRTSTERRSSIGSQARSLLQVGSASRPSDVGSVRSISPAPQIGHLNLATNSEQAATWSAGTSAQPVRTGNFATMFTDSPVAAAGDGLEVNEFGKTTAGSTTGPSSHPSTGPGRGSASEAFMNQ
ncbi:hypothetical protein OC835_007035, partial [Tilletia horrida]